MLSRNVVYTRSLHAQFTRAVYACTPKHFSKLATPSNCGDVLRALNTNQALKGEKTAVYSFTKSELAAWGQGNDLGYSKNLGDWTIRSQARQPLGTPSVHGSLTEKARVQFTD